MENKQDERYVNVRKFIKYHEDNNLYDENIDVITEFGGAYDCALVCEGEENYGSIIDGCGDCVQPGNECEEDCNGDIGGSAIYDDCGICSGGNTGVVSNNISECVYNPSQWQNYPNLDCNCDCEGSAFLDFCNVCSEGLTDHIANSDIDCTGYDINGNIIFENLEEACFGEATLDS